MNDKRPQYLNHRYVACWSIKPAIGILMLTCFLSGTNVVTAQEWSITTADFRSQPAALTGLSKEGVHFRSPSSNADQIVGLDDLLKLRRSAAPAPSVKGTFSLLLINGDHLTGEPVSLQEETLVWSSPCLGNVNLPISQLRIISRGNMIASPGSPKQDTIVLANSDAASGVVAGLTDGMMTLQTDAAARRIPISQIKSITFAQTTTPLESNVKPSYRVGLNDESTLSARNVEVNGRHLEITPFDAGGEIIHMDLTRVVSIERIDGPVSWLSSHIPTENVQADYFGGSTQWPTRFNQAVDGQPLSFDRHRYDYGIGVHAYSRLTFAIEPQWVGFRTQYAIYSADERQCPYADVTVRIKLDGKVVHEQTHLREATLSPVVCLAIKNCKVLTLECDYGINGDTQAAVNWLEPALLRALPAEHINPK